MDRELAKKCQEALSYYDRLNLEYAIERQYKIEQGYDKMGLNWAFTDLDRQRIRQLFKETTEWIVLLEAIPIIRKAVVVEITAHMNKRDVGGIYPEWALSDKQYCDYRGEPWKDKKLTGEV